MARSLFLNILILIALSSCSDKGFVINGKLEGSSPGDMIYLYRLNSQSIEAYDSSMINDEGYFLLEGEIDNPGFFILKTTDESMITALLEPEENLTITSHYDSLNNPSFIDGSEGTELMFEYNRRLIGTIRDLTELTEVYRQNMDSPDLDQIMADLSRREQTILGELNEYTRSYIDKNLTSMAAMVALYQQVAPGVYVMNPEKDLDYFLRVDSALFSLYPESEPIINFHEQVAMLAESVKSQMGGNSGLSPGAMAPDFSLPDKNGREISLSSSRGKIVLLDFWAAWCPPCRQENPNLVAAYKKYSKEGFQIFQVSLDKTREAWLKGIEDDGLGEWIHVSDLEYWDSAVVPLYGLQAIPTNYLLDRDGRIIASNLRGDALNDKLKEIF